ncbi:MAG: hypothetical protein OSJ63_04030 [Bacilli bacterium]|nr:hypothetical protein [Bacilli bacterium]
MKYISKKEVIKKLDKKVSLKHIENQVLDVIKEVGDVSVEEICSYFFPKSSINMAMFYNTFIVPLVSNKDIELLNAKEDDRFYYGSDRILGKVILRLGKEN